MRKNRRTNGAWELYSFAPPLFQSQRFFYAPLWLCVTLTVLIGGCHRDPAAKSARQEERMQRRLRNGRVVPPGEVAVDSVQIEGTPNAKIKKDLRSGIATQPSSSFLWTKRYELFDEVELEKDLERIEREMRRRGYYEARVVAARVIREREERTDAPPQVSVEIEITPGEPILIRRLETEGLADLRFDAAEAAISGNRLRVGQIFDEDEFEAAKKDVEQSLADRGYAFSQVTGRARVDLAAHSAEVVLTATPGPLAHFGEVSVVGLERLSEKSVRRILRIKKGDRFSSARIKAARSALFEQGVFSRVELIPNLSDPSSKTVPLTVHLEEGPLRDVTLGAGARLDLLRLGAVAQGSWTHRNFLGGLRRFTVSTRPGLTFFPTRIDNLKAPTNVFPENFASVRLEQPAFVEARTRGFVETGYNIYPLLYPIPDDSDPKDERVIGYHEVTLALGASRSFFGRLLFASLSLNWQANFPFTYQGRQDNEDLIPVQVTYPELITNIDLRDDPLQPTQGAYFSNSLQVAVPLIKDQPSDVRIHPEIRTFVPLDKRHRLVLATRFGIGMVFPQNYGQALTEAEGDSIIDLDDTSFIHDQQRLLFRAFYSGGPSSNRGYPYRLVGPQGAIGFLLPSEEDCTGTLNTLPSTCIRPLGGFSLWEASTELRFRAFEKWSFVGFVDASDVSTKVSRFTFVEPHIAVGPGVRYLSPVGPIRFDVAFRVPYLQKLGPVSGEPPDVSEVPPYYLSGRDDDRPYDNQPWYKRFALQILIGEDF